MTAAPTGAGTDSLSLFFIPCAQERDRLCASVSTGNDPLIAAGLPTQRWVGSEPHSLVVRFKGRRCDLARLRLLTALAEWEGLDASRGVIWRPTTGALGGYVLVTGHRARDCVEYTAVEGHPTRLGLSKSRSPHVPNIPGIDVMPADLRDDLALVRAAESRGLGTVEVR